MKIEKSDKLLIHFHFSIERIRNQITNHYTIFIFGFAMEKLLDVL